MQMKKLFFMYLGVFLLALCGCGTVCQKQEIPALRCQKNIFIPEIIYAVPGVECNIYFRNVFLAVNHNNFVFDVVCDAGSHRADRWKFVPAKSDEGKKIPFTLQVFDENETLVAEAETTICVAPANAGNGKNVSILMFGDSLTAATAYPRKLHKHCSTPGNIKLTMIGTHAGRGKVATPGEVAHEGYGGWRWVDFLTRYRDESKMSQRRKIGAKSKFLFPENGKPVFDFKKYLAIRNGGKTPDIITFQLGVNDVFRATSQTLDDYIAKILKNADTLIEKIQKVAPDARIGIGYVTPGADQNAFAINYKCKQTSWGYYRNSFRLNQAMAKHFAGRKNITMIPVNVNLDTVNHFPTAETEINPQLKLVRQNNGVHPSYWGYNQMGDSYYAWLKYSLSTTEKK